MARSGGTEPKRRRSESAARPKSKSPARPSPRPPPPPKERHHQQCSEEKHERPMGKADLPDGPVTPAVHRPRHRVEVAETWNGVRVRRPREGSGMVRRK